MKDNYALNHYINKRILISEYKGIRAWTHPYEAIIREISPSNEYIRIETNDRHRWICRKYIRVVEELN